MFQRVVKTRAAVTGGLGPRAANEARGVRTGAAQVGPEGQL